jgi:hypothetical protein
MSETGSPTALCSKENELPFENDLKISTLNLKIPIPSSSPKSVIKAHRKRVLSEVMKYANNTKTLKPNQYPSLDNSPSHNLKAKDVCNFLENENIKELKKKFEISRIQTNFFAYVKEQISVLLSGQTKCTCKSILEQYFKEETTTLFKVATDVGFWDPGNSTTRSCASYERETHAELNQDTSSCENSSNFGSFPEEKLLPSRPQTANSIRYSKSKSSNWSHNNPESHDDTNKTKEAMLLSDLKKKSSEFENLMEDYKLLEDTLKTLKKRITSLAADNAKLSKDMENVLRLNDVIRKENHALIETLNQKNKIMKELNDNLSVLANNKEEFEKLKHSLAETTRSMLDSKKSVSEAMNSNEQLKKSNNDLKELLDVKSKSQQAVIDRLQLENEARIEARNCEIFDRQAVIDRLQLENEARIEARNREIFERQAVIDRLQLENKARIEAKNYEIFERQRESNELRAKVKDLQNIIDLNAQKYEVQTKQRVIIQYIESPNIQPHKAPVNKPKSPEKTFVIKEHKVEQPKLSPKKQDFPVFDESIIIHTNDEEYANDSIDFLI